MPVDRRVDLVLNMDEAAENFSRFGGVIPVISRHLDKLTRDPAVLGVRPGLSTDLGAAIFVVRVPWKNPSGLPSEIDGFPVLVTDASIQEQSEGVLPLVVWQGYSNESGTSPAITYRPPDPGEAELRECQVAKITCHVGPDSGWATLKPFLEGTKRRLTVAMYEFHADHIVRLVSDLGRSGQLSMDMILQVSKNDAGLESMLRESWGDRFSFVPASVTGPNRVFNNSYHTKVAVRDSDSMWLSSGNWSPNSQPSVDPTVERNLFSKGNREWHVIVSDENLSHMFEKFIQHDIKMAGRAVTRDGEKFLPDLFVPESFFDEREAAVSQPRPFVATEIGSPGAPIRVKPLLSPDNYADEVLSLIRAASRSLYLQFSYIRQPSYGRFDEMIDAIRQKMNDGVDVRVLVGNSQQKEHSDMLVELRGWDPKQFRRQTSRLHNKGILVDSRIAVVGSNNWSTDGTQYNRDASLIIYSEAAAQYFAEVFLFDWQYLSRPIISETEASPVIAQDGEPTPDGMVRVPWNEWFE